MKISSFNLKLAALAVISLSTLKGYSEIFSDNDFNYEVLESNPKAVIVKSLSNASTSKHQLTIPERVSFDKKSYKVEELDENLCKGNQNLTDITIPYNIKNIGGHAFEGCINLSSIILPSSIVSIGEAAFMNCRGLKNISFGEQFCSELEEIRKNAFAGCLNLGDFSINNSKLKLIGDGAFYECKKLSNIYIYTTSPLSIGKQSFSNCTKLRHAEFGSIADESIRTIIVQEEAFKNCSELTRLQFTYSGVPLTSVVLSNKSIFQGCTKLSSLTLPPTIQLKGEKDPFYYCIGLKEIVLNSGAKTVKVEESFDLGNIEGTGDIKIVESVYDKVTLLLMPSINPKTLPYPWCNFKTKKTFTSNGLLTTNDNSSKVNSSSSSDFDTEPIQRVISFGGHRFLKNITK